MLKPAVAAIAICLAGGGAAAAQDTGAGLIRAIFAGAEDQMRTSGMNFERVEELTGSLSHGASRGDIVRLSAGSYLIAGACDEDCSDLDLVVRNTNAEVLGSDQLEDDAPVVVLEGVPAGSYQIESRMAACSAEPCLTGVRVYRLR